MIQMKPYVKVELTFIALDSNGLLSQANNGEIRDRMEKTIEMEQVQGWIDTILANLNKIGIELRA